MSMSISESLVIEIPLVTGQTKYTVGRLSQLDGKKVTAITFRTTGKSKLNTDIFNPSATGYLTLKAKNSNEKPVEIPCELLAYAGTYPPLAIRPFVPQEFDWENSEVFFAAQPTNGQTCQFTVFYQ